MSSNRIGGVNTTPTYIQLNTPVQQPAEMPSQAVTAAAPKGPVNLFDASTYAKAVSVQHAGGGNVSLPSLSEEQAAQAKSLFAKVDDDKQGEVNAASTALGQALLQQMLAGQSSQITLDDGSGENAMAGPGRVSLTAAAKSRTVNTGNVNAGLSDAVRAAASTNTGPSTNVSGVSVARVSPALTSASLAAASSYSRATGNAATGTDAASAATYMGLVGLQGELSSYADDMNATTNQKKSLDNDASVLNLAISEWPAGTDTQLLPQVTPNKDGSVTVVQVSMTKAQAQASLDAAKTASQDLGSDQQLQSIKLQSMMSNYSNAVNQMSNILKAAYDAEKNTLGNVRY